ncbi:VOC family protein [Paenibacillus sp. SN-8-1]|uniref:VOC family protein n=1 Tax=Paenibacillus sp. SN-8-1 TaxID=3435409 RepID=UPI003D9AA684
MSTNYDQEQATGSKNHLRNRIGSVFIPVRDIEKARDWYCNLLGLSADCEIIGGHLCALPMEGPGVILDTMPMWGGKEPGGAPSINTPAFMFLTGDIHSSYKFMKDNNITLITSVQDDHWFVIQDPDGNLLMICKE